MSKDSYTKYNENNKKKILQREALEKYWSLSKQEKKKCDNMVVNDEKIYQKIRNKNWLSIEKNTAKWENKILSFGKSYGWAWRLFLSVGPGEWTRSDTQAGASLRNFFFW